MDDVIIARAPACPRRRHLDRRAPRPAIRGKRHRVLPLNAARLIGRRLRSSLVMPGKLAPLFQLTAGAMISQWRKRSKSYPQLQETDSCRSRAKFKSRKFSFEIRSEKFDGMAVGFRPSAENFCAYKSPSRACRSYQLCDFRPVSWRRMRAPTRAQRRPAERPPKPSVF